MVLDKSFITRLNKLGKQKIPFLFIIDFDGTKASQIIPLSELKNSSSIQFKINSVSNTSFNKKSIQKNIQLIKHPISYEQYYKAFEYCLAELKFGNSYLLNLTFPTRIDINLTLQEIFDFSQAKYKLHLDEQFVCFSPETFVQIKNGIISSNPMKGTILANIENAKQRLLENKKEYAEHATIVDLIRNDLNRVAKQNCRIIIMNILAIYYQDCCQQVLSQARQNVKQSKLSKQQNSMTEDFTLVFLVILMVKI